MLTTILNTIYMVFNEIIYSPVTYSDLLMQ